MTRRLLVVVMTLIMVACSDAGSRPSDLDPELRAGSDVFNSICAACHGGNGEGGSAPALDLVQETFGSCEDQTRWISLGSQRWTEEVGPTYGDTDKEITAVMPSFAESLSETEIAQVAAFERHQFGGAPEEEALTDCGLSS